jgi:hypothetical protein
MTIIDLGKQAGRHVAMAMLSLALVVPSAAVTQQRGDRVRAAPTADEDRPSPNQTRPLPEIVARVQATPPYNEMDYIGVAGFETRTMIYVLRFLDGRQVVVVHVDARSGRIVGRGPR